tara:strand:- start:461 stop:751 length:291 start_codon:yes stop_codon:yes gene_type:complete
MNSILKIVDDELAFAEKSVINGGYLPATISAKIAGVGRKYVYELGHKGKIEMIVVDGQFYFSVPDCVAFRLKKRQLGGLPDSTGRSRVAPASEPRQ